MPVPVSKGKLSVSAENAGNDGSDDVIVSVSDQNQVGVPMNASKSKLQASSTTDVQVDGVNRRDNQQWTFMHMSKLNDVIKDMLCPECGCQGVTVKITNNMGFSSEVTLQCSNTARTYTSNMHTSPRAEGGKLGGRQTF